jgi:hypothetical protein
MEKPNYEQLGFMEKPNYEQLGFMEKQCIPVNEILRTLIYNGTYLKM